MQISTQILTCDQFDVKWSITPVLVSNIINNLFNILNHGQGYVGIARTLVGVYDCIKFRSSLIFSELKFKYNGE